MSQVRELLTRGVTNIIPNKLSLEEKINQKIPLNIYLGIDPTATRIHLGHAVQLRKLQKFADLGHNVTFLIGDFTSLIGDTSDKDSERPSLSKEEVKKNFTTYKKQAEKIVDFTRIKIKNNSEWLSKLTFEDIVNLTQHFTLGDFTSRELIRKRIEKGTRVGLHEVLYPVMQGYDSYHMNTDIQIGGSDQIFNMQAGRTLQKVLRDKESYIITTEFLMGTDGRKMSKSWGNAIWLDDKPDDIYTKLMQINDEQIRNYFMLATDINQEEIEKMNITKDPLKYKKMLGQTIVTDLYSEENAKKAAKNFESIVQKGEIPQNIKGFTISSKRAQNTSLPHLLFDAGLASTVSQARRLIRQNAVEVNGEKTQDIDQIIENDTIIKSGKRNIIKIKVEEEK